MICQQCRLDVVPDAPLMTCPECWSPIELKWNPSVMGGSVNRAIISRGAVRASINIGCLPEHLRTMDLYYDMMMKFDCLYDVYLKDDLDIEIREGDTVIKIEERALVSSVVAAIIVTFFVLNEVFGFINY